MFELRRQQVEFQDLMLDIREGRKPASSIVIAAAPGSGKGSIPVMMASLGCGSLFEKVAVVVPRDALRKQCAEEFTKAHWSGHFKRSLEIRETVSDMDPTRGTAGFVTTYDAVRGAGAEYLLEDMRRRSYGVCFDEIHHAAVDSVTHSALRRMMDLARLAVLQSGTLERGDKRPIAFLPYEGGPRAVTVDSSKASGFHWIRYGIADALREQAIIPIEFRHVDGSVEWCDSTGMVRSVTSLSEDEEAVFAALDSRYGQQLLDACVSDFRDRRRRNPRAQMLVVCWQQSEARRYLEHLRATGYSVGLAISDEKGANGAIEQFRAGATEILVTVAMAYEGLDVPAVTHIACLTRIRSAPWILQMFARAWRFDRNPGAGPYETQSAVAFVPDDPEMRAVIAYIQGEMNSAKVMLPSEGDRERRESEPSIGDKVVALSSRITKISASDWDGEQLSADEIARIEGAAARIGIRGFTALELKRFMELASEDAQHDSDEPAGATVREREMAYRKKIEERLRRYDAENQREPGSANKEIFRRFSKSRDNMSEGELREVWAHVSKFYQLRRSA